MKQSSTLSDVRISNGKVVVHTLFHSMLMTKQELAERTNLSLPTISSILKNLKEKGLITQGKKLDSFGGRPAMYIQPVYNAAYSIGINISANHVRFALTDLTPKIIKREKHVIPLSSTKAYWKQISNLLDDFIINHNVDTNKLLGVGISIRTALTSSSTGIATLLAGGNRINMDLNMVKDIFSKYSISINNDAKMASYAYAWENLNLENFVYLNIGSNIGGSIVNDLDVLHFEKKNAEFGHMTIIPNGRTCGCGMQGCFDSYCSSTALRDISAMPVTEFFEKLKGGDPACQEIWDEYIENLCIALNNIRVIFDLDIVISGEMSQYLADYSDRIKSVLKAKSTFRETTAYIHICDNGEYSAAFGAGLIFNDHFLSSLF
jgi:predicted NBD/HSP70 family sugar kinase